MSEEKAEVKPSFNPDSLKAKLDEVEKKVKTHAGKPNMNPFVWIKKNIEPLRQRLLKGEKTPELALAINNLKDAPPIVNPVAPKVEQPKAPIVPPGLKLK